MINKSHYVKSGPLLPRKLDIVKFKGKANVLNLKYFWILLFLIFFSGFRMGDKYTPVLKEALLICFFKLKQIRFSA